MGNFDGTLNACYSSRKRGGEGVERVKSSFDFLKKL